MPTLVRVEKSLVRLTSEGWKSDEHWLQLLCQSKTERGAGRFHQDRNPHKAMAEQLVSAFKEEGIDAEIISIEK